MTHCKIQHILTGLKAEIRREKDPQRREHLAIMGLYWNRLYMTGTESKVCKTCKESLPLKHFELMVVKYRRKKGGSNVCLSRRNECKKCYNKAGWQRAKRRKERNTLIFDTDFHC